MSVIFLPSLCYYGIAVHQSLNLDTTRHPFPLSVPNPQVDHHVLFFTYNISRVWASHLISEAFFRLSLFFSWSTGFPISALALCNQLILHTANNVIFLECQCDHTTYLLKGLHCIPTDLKIKSSNCMWPGLPLSSACCRRLIPNFSFLMHLLLSGLSASYIFYSHFFFFFNLM